MAMQPSSSPSSAWPFERRTTLLASDAEAAIFGVEVVRRKEVVLASLNLHGSTLMGMTPKYKRQLVNRFLLDVQPDVIFIQDAFENDQMNEILSAVPNIDYQLHVRVGLQEETQGEEKQVEGGAADGLVGALTPTTSTSASSSSIALAWNESKFTGSVLEADDSRLREFGAWIQDHDIVVVQLTSVDRVDYEDVYPSFVAISWQGVDYLQSQSTRTRVAESFLRGLRRLRSKKWRVPIVVGGDFKLDMREYESVLNASEFSLISFAPVPSLMSRDMRNTFVFTLDSLMVTEKALRQYHPNTFETPFISITMKARHRLRLWAVVTIQRAVRRWLQRARHERDTRKRIRDKQKVWKIRHGIKDDEDIQHHSHRDNDLDLRSLKKTLYSKPSTKQEKKNHHRHHRHKEMQSKEESSSTHKHNKDTKEKKESRAKEEKKRRTREREEKMETNKERKQTIEESDVRERPKKSNNNGYGEHTRRRAETDKKRNNNNKTQSHYDGNNRKEGRKEDVEMRRRSRSKDTDKKSNRRK